MNIRGKRVVSVHVQKKKEKKNNMPLNGHFPFM